MTKDEMTDILIRPGSTSLDAQLEAQKERERALAESAEDAKPEDLLALLHPLQVRELERLAAACKTGAVTSQSALIDELGAICFPRSCMMGRGYAAAVSILVYISQRQE